MNAKKLLKKHLDINTPKNKYLSEKQLINLRYEASINAINEALNMHIVGITLPTKEELHSEIVDLVGREKLRKAKDRLNDDKLLGFKIGFIKCYQWIKLNGN